MKTYYELTPNSPFFPYMQDRSVENALTGDEKEKLYLEAINALVFSGLENMEFGENERNYLIYAFLNKIDPDFMGDKLIELGE